MSESNVVFRSLEAGGGAYKPRAYQKAAHRMRLACRFLVLVWHRRAGKTVFAVLELVLAALACTKPRGRFAYIAPFLSQAKDIAWDYLKHFAADVPGAVVREAELAIDFPNGARVRVFGADNPQAFRGRYLDGAVLDEVAQMKPGIWGEILRPLLMDRQGWVLFIGTPRGVNLFSTLFNDARKPEFQAKGWGADMKRWHETGALPHDEIEQARAEMTPNEWAQEMDCDFAAASDDVFIRLDVVLAAQRRKLSADAYHHAGKALGVDVARFGKDRTSLTMRQGLLAHPAIVMKQASTMQVAAQVAFVIEKEQPDAVFVDEGGVGGGVIDRLHQLGHMVIPVDFGSAATSPRFENKRSEMWWEMAEWLKLAAVPDDADLAQDFITPTYTFKNDRGRIQLESKKHIRARGLKSPDLADSLACTFFAPVVPAAMRRKTHTVKTDYDWRTHGR